MDKNRLSPLAFLLIILFTFPLSKNYSSLSAQDPFIVVLDAGHGGHDPGNLGNGYLEKNIALNIVLHAGRMLEQNPDIEVVYTRKDDTFVDLFVRGEIANKAKADLFVSVHCDSHSSDAYGAGTFVLGLHANEQNFEIAKKENSVIYLEDNYATRYADYDINSPESVIGLTIMQEEFLDQSIALAKSIQDNFATSLKRKDRKVKQAGFIVLHQTFMPSVLVETGFLTNEKEGAYLNSSKGQSEMGTAIAQAIMRYKSNAISTTNQNQISSMPSAPDPENDLAEADVAEINEAPSEENIAKEMKEPVTEAVVDKVDELPEVVDETPQVTNNEVKKMLEEAEKKSLESISNNEEKELAEVEKNVPVAVDNTPNQKTEKVITEVNEPGRPKIIKEEIKKVSEPEVVQSEPVEAPPVVVEEPEVKISKPAEVPPVVAEKAAEKIVEVPKIEERPTPKANVEFRVQLMASAKNLLASDPIFKGLNEISKEPYQNLYRYMHGSTNSYIKATLLKKVADAKGFSTSFLVAYVDGVRTDVREAKKYASE